MGQIFQFNHGKGHIENEIVRNHNSKNGSGNGGDGGMLEARVAKLEANVEHIASDATEIKQNLKTTSSDVSKLVTDLALSKKDIEDIKTATSSLKQDLANFDGRILTLEKSITSFKTTIKVSAAVISTAVVIFGLIAGPYLAKIASIINSLALKP